jgi:GNAT superfamily N-acetyltransferase
MALSIRPARPNDRAFVISAVPRLVSFDPPPWRLGADIVKAETRAIEAFFTVPAAGSALFVAEGEDGAPLGFVYLERQEDYFTHDPHGHISMVVVSAEAQGRGVGGELMRAAEAWARSQGYSKLTLTVFDANRTARAVYEHLGYAPETLRYVKVL